MAEYLAEISSQWGSIVLESSVCCSERHKVSPATRLVVDLLSRLFHYDLALLPPLHSVVQNALPLTRKAHSGLDCPLDDLLDFLDCFLNLGLQTTLIIDALDECIDSDKYDPREFSNFLYRLRQFGSRENTEIIIFSRTGSFSEDVYAGTNQLSIDAEAIQSDIKRFVRHEMEGLCLQSPSIQHSMVEIVDQVSTKCQSMFLLANFMMESLAMASTPNERNLIINEFPGKLIDFYQLQWRRIERRLSSNDKIRRHSMFSLLVGAFSPLEADEISLILALNPTSNSVQAGEKFDNPIVTVLKLGGPLIKIVDGQVRFVHTTVKEFFLKTSRITREDSDAFLALKCLTVLSGPKYKGWEFSAKLLRRNLLPGGNVDDLGGDDDGSFYEYATLHWYEHLTALANPSNELLSKLASFLTGNEFVASSETLLQLKPNAGTGVQVQIKSAIAKWYKDLPPEKQQMIPIGDYFVKPHESLSNTLKKREREDKILQYLPYVRLGRFFNVSGKPIEAYKYEKIVVAGYEAVLGLRNPLTLRAKTAMLKEFFFLKRFDEIEQGLDEVARIQRKVIGEDALDYLISLQLLGAARLSVTKFDYAINTLIQAIQGFRKLSGNDDFNTLVSGMYQGHTLEREARFDEALQIYDENLKIWISIGGSSHPLSLMLKTAIGSACRQLRRFPESQTALLEALSARGRLFTAEHHVYIDTVLQLAALYSVWGRYKDSIRFLDLIATSDTLKGEFERKSQYIHIRALVDISKGQFERAKQALRRILHEASIETPRIINRELLWIRITLADVLRVCGERDEALMLFADLVSSRGAERVGPEDCQEPGSNEYFSLDDEPEPPAQLVIAERALRLVKDTKPKEAEMLLCDHNLKWKREKDFWVIQGGPVVDTASMSGLKSSDGLLNLV
jgi:tetratricopeptide (TPR) repeat protein